MSEPTTLPVGELIDHAAIDRAHELATRDALLEHARMGRCVSASRDGKIVDVTPAEIFRRYGLDPFGRPMRDPDQPPLNPQIIARLHIRDELDRMHRDGLFAEYAGEHIVFADGQIRGHAPRLIDAHRAAVEKHPEIDPDDFIDYYIPFAE